VGLVAACDMAVALEKVTFCLSEVKLGIAPAVISPFLLEKMGSSALRRYALTAEPFDAIQARRVGLVTDVVENFGELDTWINEVADALRVTSRLAVAATKEILHGIGGLPLDDAQAFTAKTIAELRASAEGQEGLKAFLEKRKPKWLLDE
jgi:methylglutaconyl-CoA hydratase